MTVGKQSNAAIGEGASRAPLRSPSINSSAIRYWELTGYTASDIGALCNQINSEWMFAVVTFLGNGKISFDISQRTWDRGEGHYPTVMQVFAAIAKHPLLRNERGNIVVWLEDGMWDWCQPYSRKIPMLAFGRNVHDSTTLLMPDPAYIGAIGYEDDFVQSRRFREMIPWERRESTIFWRGAATGIGIEGPEWGATARARLACKAQEVGDSRIIDAKLSRVKHLPQEAAEGLRARGLVDAEVPFERFFHYKYMVDADGYHCAWKSLFLKLATGSTVLKMNSPFEQWYHRELVPWRHYIPVSSDLSDLMDIYSWLITHDQQAKEIAETGASFASSVTLDGAVEGIITSVAQVLRCQRNS